MKLSDKIYLIEFKYGKVGTAMETLMHQALQQIRAKNHGERFWNDSRPRLLLGIRFVDKVMGYQLMTDS